MRDALTWRVKPVFSARWTNTMPGFFGQPREAEPLPQDSKVSELFVTDRAQCPASQSRAPPKAKRELEETWKDIFAPHFAPLLLKLRPLQTAVGDFCPPLPKPSTILPYIPEEKCLHYLPPSSPLAKQMRGGFTKGS